MIFNLKESKKTKKRKDCGGFQKPKGHLDTQMFPECEGTRFDRNIVKKTVEERERKKKKSEVCKECIIKEAKDCQLKAIFNLKKYKGQ